MKKESKGTIRAGGSDKGRQELKREVFKMIQVGSREDIKSRLFDVLLTLAIFLNIAVLFLGTFEEMAPWRGAMRIVELSTVAFFCLEYILRIWTADLLYPQLSRGAAVVKFLLSFDGVVDFLTIVPAFFLSGFIALRLLRVVRIFHLFRINANVDSFNVIKTVLYEKRNQLLSSIFIILVLMLAASLTMYGAEHAAQPGVYKNAFSGLWWSMSTIFTVGYGDIYPVTPAGRVIAVIITFLGVGAVAIPTGIISAGFVEQYQQIARSSMQSRQRRMNTCTMVVEKDSPFIGTRIDELETAYEVLVTGIIREGALLVASDSVILKEADTVLYLINDFDLQGEKGQGDPLKAP